MARDKKAPAFQWYPKDILTDGKVIPMTLEEEGAYRRLIDQCWLDKRLPSNLETLAAMCKNVSAEKMRVMWNRIEPCFTRVEEGGIAFFIHPRLEKERRKQAKNRKARQLAAKARWDKEQSERDANALHLVSPPTPSATPVHKERAPRARKCHPDSRAFVQWFESEFPNHRGGTPYLVEWGRDTRAASGMLEKFSLERLKKLALMLWGAAGDSEWKTKDTDRGVMALRSNVVLLDGILRAHERQAS